ncbi:MAG: diaminopimelate epimerase [Pyrinomonadaceae bacterium]
MLFAKFHGYGNDYIVVEATALSRVMSLVDALAVSDFVRRICHRHYGAGGDGVALIEKLNDAAADYHVRIFNADGGEAAMSGNGTRCAAAYLYHEKLWAQDELRFATRAGIKRYVFHENVGKIFRFEAEIGRPRFESAAIPMQPEKELSRVLDYTLPLAVDESVRVTALQMCNPNCCVFVDDFDEIDWRRIGNLIEHHAQFPECTNVEFIRVMNRRQIEVRVWERGVGETLASGTGACAAAVASRIKGLTERKLTVEMPGGKLKVEWRESDDEVVLTGDAEAVYRGEIF